jgi:antagonist of KipI
MSSLHVLRPGLQTTVQDRGRWGWQARGVPVAGAMDQYSYRVANALVGNPVEAAVLEVAIVGPELAFEDARIVAAAGAEFSITVDERMVPMFEPFSVAAGSCLRFGARMHGARAYLSIAGGIDVPTVLGSRSTHVLSRMGGFHGRALMAGDRVPLGPPQDAGKGVFGRSRIAKTGRARDIATVLRILPDVGTGRFTNAAIDALQSAPYVVSPASDRMGFRLEGPRLAHAQGADILSEITPIGTLQVPASGQPILLMADRQTTGGYPKVGTVITADIPIAAQSAPGDRVTFAVCTIGEAHTARLEQERALRAIEELARA